MRITKRIRRMGVEAVGINLAVLMSVWFLAAPAFATEACSPLTEAEFATRVVKVSQLALVGVIDGFSSSPASAHGGESWTRIKPEISVIGKLPKGEITVSGWQARQLPLFAYEKGQRVLLFLKKEGERYLLSDQSWEECVPSVLDVDGKGQVQIGLSAAQRKFHRTSVRIAEFKAYLESVLK